MSSLWTPDGERRVPPADAGARSGGAPGPAEERTPRQTDPGGGEPEPLDPEAEARYREDLAQLEAELLEVPAADIIANHCYGIFQLAALHLSQKPPRLEEAKAAIDAFGAVVETLGDRLGRSTETLREGLSQIRLAYVEISRPAGG